jgi:DNA-binding NtrC family response regulator
VLESELFGHERGAFTGARERRDGRFKLADQGTLFLDEVSEIPKGVQVKLLRFLQEREYERVGSNRTERVDVRVVAACNLDLAKRVEDGSFREDLFYRLNVVDILVPPLRRRHQDIPILAQYFVRRACADNGSAAIQRLSDAVVQRLLTYPWPGNVRELQNAMERAVAVSTGDVITPDDLPASLRDQSLSDDLRLAIPGMTLAELERFAVLRTLEAVDWSPAKAARILGISTRTIQYRLKEWNVDRAELSAHLKDELQLKEEPPN